VFPKHVSANFWLPQVVWQEVPHRRASHSESPPGHVRALSMRVNFRCTVQCSSSYGL